MLTPALAPLAAASAPRRALGSQTIRTGECRPCRMYLKVRRTTQSLQACQLTDLCALPGEFDHEDVKGHKGRLAAGDVQFMIAGRGIVHSEMPVHGPGKKDPYGLQLCVLSSLPRPSRPDAACSPFRSPSLRWIDLPKEHKMVEASYQERKASEISSAHPTPNVEIKVVCGEAQGSAEEGLVQGNVRPLGGCWFLHFLMAKKGERVWQAVPAGWNAFVRWASCRPLPVPLIRLRSATLSPFALAHTVLPTRPTGLHAQGGDPRRPLLFLLAQRGPQGPPLAVPHRSPLERVRRDGRLARSRERRRELCACRGRAPRPARRAARAVRHDVAAGDRADVPRLPAAEEWVRGRA